VESIQSLPRHHYGPFMIDYTHRNYSKSLFYEEAVTRWSPFTSTNYELGVTISGRLVAIYALFGGQSPHSSYMVKGSPLPLRIAMNAVDVAPTRQTDLCGLLRDIEQLETIFAGWESASRNTAQAYRGASEALHGEALRWLIGSP
jgi:hypothetical protein